MDMILKPLGHAVGDPVVAEGQNVFQMALDQPPPFCLGDKPDLFPFSPRFTNRLAQPFLEAVP